MGKIFSKKKKKSKNAKTVPNQENIQPLEVNLKPNIPNPKEEEEEEEENVINPLREFDDTPLPSPYNAPQDSPFLSIPRLSQALSSDDGIPIWNASDMFWQEKFDYLGLLDDSFEDDFETIKKTKIKDMTKKQCCEFITYYMRTNTFTKGTSNGDIQKLAKRYNDLISSEEKNDIPEEEEEIEYPDEFEADENSKLLTVFQKVPYFIVDGKAEIKEEHIKWSERFKKMGLYDDNCDDLSDIEKKRIEKMDKNEVLKFMSYYVKKNMIPQAIGNGDLGRLAKRYNDLISEEN